MKIVKATMEEIRAYQDTDPVAVLFGWVSMEGHRMPVEYLGEGRDNPNYEVLAPKGMIFGSGVHTILGFTQSDLLEQLRYDTLEGDVEEVAYVG